MVCFRALSFRVAAALFIVVFAYAPAQSAKADTIYQETFPNTSTTNANLALSSAGWAAYGSTTCTDYSNNTGDYSVTYYNGCGSTAGFAFVKPGLSGRVLAYTSEFSSIDLSSYNSLAFSWYQNVASTSMASQLAVEIAGVWYVSAATYANSTSGSGDQFFAGALQKSPSLSSITNWYVLTVTPGSVLSVGTTAVSLPTTGAIVAAGLYATGGDSSNASFRFDNFTISGTAVPEPDVLTLLAAAALSLIAYARRKRKNQIQDV
jgi:hypothetical protein